MRSLSEVASSLISSGKGIFAADASPATLIKRGLEAGVDFGDQDRRLAYRRMTVFVPGLSRYIGGVILHEEALGLANELAGAGILPGVKVDRGTIGEREKVTQGLMDLQLRLEEYVSQPVAFTKWRAVITIGPSTPTLENLDQNASDLARYAKLSQNAGLVPVVEPEVLMAGDHNIDQCARVTAMVGKKVFEALTKEGVDLAGMLYKMNMVLAGADTVQPTDGEIARKTVEAVRQTVPDQVAGIVFLSGGQGAVEATRRLNEIVRQDSSRRYSFSFERAIEGPAMRIWAGQDNNFPEAQKIILHRARCNSLASQAKYSQEVENEI